MWFFRAVETPEGLWECRHGRGVVFDVHRDLHDAVSHLHRLAGERDHAVEIFVHWLGGAARRVDAGSAVGGGGAGLSASFGKALS